LLSTKSLKLNFIIKLSTAMVVLLVLFSSILYIYIEYSVEKDMQDILIKQSRFIVANYPDLKNSIEKHKPILKKMLNIRC